MPGSYTAGWGGSVSWPFTTPEYDFSRRWSAAWDAPVASGPQSTASTGSLSTAGLGVGSHNLVLTFFFADGATAVLDSPSVGVQAAPQWRLALSAGAAQADLGQSVTLTVSSNVDVGPTPFYLEIYDLTTGTLAGSCGGATVCAVELSESAATTQSYVAQVAAYGGGDAESA